MPRDFFINGESLVLVKGRSNGPLASLQQLGLAQQTIQVSWQTQYDDFTLDAWGNVPAEVQVRLGIVSISMALIHFDPDVLEACVRESQGGAALGCVTSASQRLGNNSARFSATNYFIGLNIVSPVAGRPYRFLYTHMSSSPVSWPLGTQKSIVQLQWRAIPYTTDPYGGGLGATAAQIWDRTLDT